MLPLSLPGSGELIEVDRIHGNLYGLSHGALEQVHAAGLVAAMDLTLSGAEALCQMTETWQYRSAVPRPLCVFLKPPSLSELEFRLRHRASETEATLEVNNAGILAAIQRWSTYPSQHTHFCRCDWPAPHTSLNVLPNLISGISL